MVGYNIPSLKGCRIVEVGILSRSIEEQWDVHTQTVCQLKVRSDIKLILCIEPNLTCCEGWCPTWVACYTDIGRTVTILIQCIVIGCTTIRRCSGLTVHKHLEVIYVIEVISTVVVLNEEVLKLVILTMSTKGQVVLAKIQVNIVCKCKDILVQRVGCRRTLCTQAESTATYILNLNHWEDTMRIALVAYRNVRCLELVVYLIAEITVQLSSESIRLGTEVVLIARCIEIRSSTIAAQLLGVHHTPTNSSLMLVADVPVELNTSLIALGIVLRIIIRIYITLIFQDTEYLIGYSKAFLTQFRGRRTITIVVRIFLV